MTASTWLIVAGCTLYAAALTLALLRAAALPHPLDHPQQETTTDVH